MLLTGNGLITCLEILIDSNVNLTIQIFESMEVGDFKKLKRVSILSARLFLYSKLREVKLFKGTYVNE